MSEYKNRFVGGRAKAEHLQEAAKRRLKMITDKLEKDPTYGVINWPKKKCK